MRGKGAAVYSKFLNRGRVDEPSRFHLYRRLDKDSAVVDELTEKLSEFNPWRDMTDILGGQVWREKIAGAIDASFAMILVVSADTEQSKEVYAEYFHALAHKVH